MPSYFPDMLDAMADISLSHLTCKITSTPYSADTVEVKSSSSLFQNIILRAVKLSYKPINIRWIVATPAKAKAQSTICSGSITQLIVSATLRVSDKQANKLRRYVIETGIDCIH